MRNKEGGRIAACAYVFRIRHSQLRMELNSFGRWEFDCKLRALSDFRLDIDSGVVGFDDFLGRRQAQSGAAFFGGVKLLEHFYQRRGGHSTASIDQVKRDTHAGDSRSGQQFATVGHGFHRVFDQIYKSGLECLWVEVDAWQIGVEVPDDFDSLFRGLRFEEV